jgi:hypothetical protein
VKVKVFEGPVVVTLPSDQTSGWRVKSPLNVAVSPTLTVAVRGV